MSLFYNEAGRDIFIFAAEFKNHIFIRLASSFKVIKPIAALVPYIRYYWILENDEAVSVSERTLPVGCVQLVFHKGKQLLFSGEGVLQPQAFVCGQTMKYTDVQSMGKIEMIVVVFQPFATKLFLQMPVGKFYTHTVSVDDLEDKELIILYNRIADTADHKRCIQLIEQFLTHRLISNYQSSRYNLNRMFAVLHEIDNCPQINISGLSATACLSSKQLNRVFTEYIGASPKDFMRIVRMQRALYMLQQNRYISFIQLAYDCGFADQSHMIKEFKLFSGYTPLEYIAVCAPYSDYFSEF